MQNLTVLDILQATGGTLLKGNPNRVLTDISTDSRAKQPGSLFVAIVGARFDGNDYVEDAAVNGAACCVVSKRMDAPCDLILVDDTTTALGDIAAYYRNKFDIPFVGITGSVGKTTTKDMISCALEEKYRVLKTLGNFNNNIGLPLTVLRLDEFNEIGVTEMGMSGFGEIDYLAKIVRPETAVFTNIGLSHIEKLGSRENILKAKAEMLNYLPENGYVVFCGDDDLLWNIKEMTDRKVITYGIDNPDCDVTAKNITQNGETTEFDICVAKEQIHVSIPVLGTHNVKNALAAFCVARRYSLTNAEIVSAFKNYKPGKMRQNIIEEKGVTVINDCYNASPSSVEAGLKILAQIDKKGRKIAILGDMLELGDYSEYAHKLVGEYVVNSKADFLITVGEASENIVKSAIEKGFSADKCKSFKCNKQVMDFCDSFIQEGDVVLVKASRSMKFEEITEHIVHF
ncbi:MAG: UDP-N-acetylmuramoyl-tripeptide--D-alanyl-D-alanine ligase [Clostridia bacterium]|nr:UDP-N-acetylmuramoyl-tripeptide--D-alanyl-D-alanine ligase [Clostridia bacterium]